MKKPKLEVRPYRHSKTHKYILDLRAFGKGRQFFTTRAEADAECLRQKTLLERHSREAVGLSQREMTDFITARNKLAKYGKTINNAVTFVVDHEERIRRCNVTIRQLAEELIEAKRRDGKAPRYLESLRGYLGRFCQEFGDRLIATVTPEELDTWLRDLPYSPKSRLNYRQHIGVLFSYAKRRRMIDSNPIEFTARPKLIDKAPEIFTVDELRALLDKALRIEPDVVPMLAIGAFAGLRDSEIQQLEWNEVNQARGFIEVKAAKAKSARRRLVRIQPNLAAWLQPYTGLSGAVVPGANAQSLSRRDPARSKLLRVRKAAGLVKWPKNGLRHSFCSYRLAATNNAHLVASELGHTTSQLVYQHYREVVAPEEAERYWEIKPAGEAANVVAFAK
jgi:integrase